MTPKTEKPTQPAGTFKCYAVRGAGGVVTVGMTETELALRLRPILKAAPNLTLKQMCGAKGLTYGPAFGRPMRDEEIGRARKRVLSLDPTALWCAWRNYTDKSKVDIIGVSVTQANLKNSAVALGETKTRDPWPPPATMCYPFEVVT